MVMAWPCQAEVQEEMNGTGGRSREEAQKERTWLSSEH